MTIIAAVHIGTPASGRYFAAMGADGQMTYGYTKVPSGPKIVRRGNVLYGCAGVPAYHRFLEELPDEPPTGDWLNAMADRWVAWAHKHGRGKQNDEGTFLLDGRILVAAPSGLWTLDGDGAVTRQERYAAIGCGAETALGVLFTLARVICHTLSPAERVEVAVRACIEHVVGCGGEVMVRQVQDPPDTWRPG
mgnify:FL=1